MVDHNLPYMPIQTLFIFIYQQPESFLFSLPFVKQPDDLVIFYEFHGFDFFQHLTFRQICQTKVYFQSCEKERTCLK